MFKKKVLPPDSRIIKLRDYEERLRSFQSNVKEYEVNNALATWENKTDSRIQQNRIMNTFNELKGERELLLDARRKKLAEKLQAEEEAFQVELVESQETPEERRRILAEKARNLAKKREQSRQQVANEKLMDRFRNDCDLLRDQDSHQIHMQVVADRETQVQYKEQAKLALQEQDKIDAEMYEKLRLEKVERYESDLRKTAFNNVEATKILDMQLIENNAAREKAIILRQNEIEEMKTLAKEQEDEMAKKDQERHRRMVQLNMDMTAFNQDKQAQLREILAKNKEEEDKIVRAALDKASMEEEAEILSKASRRAGMLQYRKEIELQMQKTEADDSLKDKAIQKAQEEAQAKRDAEKFMQEEARAKLMSEVYAHRKIQISEKINQKALSQDLALEERRQQEAEMLRLQTLEDDAQAKKRLARMKNSLDVQAQIWSKEQEKFASREEKWREGDKAKEAEAQFQSLISQAQISNPNQGITYGRKSTKWFD